MKENTLVQWTALVLVICQFTILLFIGHNLYLIMTYEPVMFSGLVFFPNLGALVWYGVLTWIGLTIFFKPNQENPASDKKFVVYLAGATLIPVVLALLVPNLYRYFF